MERKEFLKFFFLSMGALMLSSFRIFGRKDKKIIRLEPYYHTRHGDLSFRPKNKFHSDVMNVKLEVFDFISGDKKQVITYFTSRNQFKTVLLSI